jgi:hypothetical protein
MTTYKVVAYNFDDLSDVEKQVNAFCSGGNSPWTVHTFGVITGHSERREKPGVCVIGLLLPIAPVPLREVFAVSV